MKNSGKKVVAAVVIVAAVVVAAVLMSLRDVEDFHDKYAGVDLNVDVEGMEREGSYSGYLNAHKDAAYSTVSVDVDLFDYTAAGDGQVEKVTEYEGAQEALYTGTGSYVSWNVDVP